MALRLWHGPADGQRLLSRGAPLLDGVYYTSGGLLSEALGGAAYQVGVSVRRRKNLGCESHP